MFSLLRMELYRMTKTKSVKIITILLTLTYIISFIATVTTSHNYIDVCSIFNANFTDRFNFLFFGILISILIADEYKNGFIKSIGGQISSRSLLTLSKLCIMSIYTVFTFIIGFISCGITSLFFTAKYNVTFGFDIAYIPVWVITIILNISMISLIILIVTITRSSSSGITTTIIISTQLTSLIYSAINWLLSKIGINSFNISVYMPDTNLLLMVPDMSYKSLLRALICAIIFTIIIIYASMNFQKKKDV